MNEFGNWVSLEVPCFHLKLIKDIFNTSSIRTTFKEFISIEILLMNWVSNKWINNDDNINKKKRTRFSFSIEFIRDGLYIFEVKMRQFHINSVWKWEILITFLFLVAMVSLYLKNTSFYAVTRDVSSWYDDTYQFRNLVAIQSWKKFSMPNISITFCTFIW